MSDVVHSPRPVSICAVIGGVFPDLRKPGSESDFYFVEADDPDVNADSIFPTCAEVKFPSWRVPMINRLSDR